jgi:hypothetical protein
MAYELFLCKAKLRRQDALLAHIVRVSAAGGAPATEAAWDIVSRWEFWWGEYMKHLGRAR